MAGEGEVLSLLGLESSLEMQETCLQGPGHPPFGPWNNLQQLNKDVQRLSQLSSRQEHGRVQAGMVQEELRVLHLHLKIASRILTSRPVG